MIDTSKTVQGFVILDPLAQVQEYINQFERDQLKRDVAAGMVLMVEYTDGSRDFIEPDEVDLSLIGTKKTIHVMEQEITVPIINAIVDILSESYTPQVAVMSAGAKKTATSKLDNLRELVDEMNDHYLPNIEGE